LTGIHAENGILYLYKMDTFFPSKLVHSTMYSSHLTVKLCIGRLKKFDISKKDLLQKVLNFDFLFIAGTEDREDFNVLLFWFNTNCCF